MNQKDKELFEIKSEHQKLIAVMNEKLSQSEDQNRILKDKLKYKDDECHKNQITFTNKVTELKEKYNSELEALRMDLEKKSEAVNSKDKQTKELENKFTFENNNLKLSLEEKDKQIEE